jgi:hypothetical protein
MVTVTRHRRRSRWGFVTVLVLVIALAGAVGPRALAGACQAGVRKVNGVSAQTFCGPATATVHVAGRTFRFAEGNCVKTADYVSVNIGTVMLAQTAKRQPDYFGLDIGRIPGSGSPPARKDGSYRSGTVLTVEYADQTYDVLAGVATLTGNRTQGTVSGKTFSGQPLTGTFHC